MRVGKREKSEAVKAIVFNHVDKKWMLYQHPMMILEARQMHEVSLVLQQAEAYANAGYHSVGFCTYEAAKAFDSYMQIVPPQDNLPLCYFAVYTKGVSFDLAKHRKKETSTFINQLNWQPSISQLRYHQDIRAIKHHLLVGDCYQINYTYRLKSAFGIRALDYFLRLLPQQQTALGAFMETTDWAICSASPELFFQLDNHLLITRPMKGTASRGQSVQQDKENKYWLERSEKNQAENTMIVDMIRNDLSRIAFEGSVKVDQLHTIEQYKTAWQMTSSVRAETDHSVVDIFKAMFPCASITGAPKVKAMEIIYQLEQQPRHIYTGSMGYILPNRQAKFNVAIRTVYVNKQSSEAEFGLGGGIVWDSISEEEYQESLVKARLLSLTN